MKKLVFATNNQNKVDEIKRVIGDRFEVVSLKDAGIDIDIPEPFDTLEENATTKSATISKLTGEVCFSEDTGLEVEALHGEPGVKSARYAGDNRDFDANVSKVLEGLAGVENRRAHFKTVISLMQDGKEHQFVGICEGEIAHERKGGQGFGYDPIFIPDGGDRTFAEMTMDEKNKFSHRKKATSRLLAFLSQTGK
jgi:XTP/dITP diphosphohydrolase